MEPVAGFSRLRVSDTPEKTIEHAEESDSLQVPKAKEISYLKPPSFNDFHLGFPSTDSRRDKKSIQSSWGGRGARSFDEAFNQTECASSLKTMERHSSFTPIFSSVERFDGTRRDGTDINSTESVPLRCTMRSFNSGSISYELNPKPPSVSVSKENQSKNYKQFKSLSLDDMLEGYSYSEEAESKNDVTYIGSYEGNVKPPPNYHHAIAFKKRVQSKLACVNDTMQRSKHLPSYSEHLQKTVSYSQPKTDVKNLGAVSQIFSASVRRESFKKKKQIRQTQSLELPHSNNDIMLPQYINAVKVPKFKGGSYDEKNEIQNSSNDLLFNNFFSPIISDVNQTKVASQNNTLEVKQSSARQNFSANQIVNHKSMNSFMQHNPDSLVNMSYDQTNQTDEANKDYLDFLPISSERRSSAQSLPDLSGPALDALCPDSSREDANVWNDFNLFSTTMTENNRSVDKVVLNDSRNEATTSADVSRVGCQLRESSLDALPALQFAKSSIGKPSEFNSSRSKMHLDSSNSFDACAVPQFPTLLSNMESHFTITQMSENLKAFSTEEYLMKEQADFTVDYVESCETYPKILTPEKRETDVYFNSGYMDSTNCLYSTNVKIDNASINEGTLMPLTPPTINVQTPEECPSSLLSSSNVITEALGDLNSDLISEEWQSTIDSFLSGIPAATPLPELVVTNQSDEKINHNLLDDDVKSINLLEAPLNYEVPTESHISNIDPSTLYSSSPMSISSGGSALQSPMRSLRNSFNSGRRYKRPHSISPYNQENLEISSIIRSSPNCLLSDPTKVNYPYGQFMDSSSPTGSYGHFIPRPETNNNNSASSNFNLSPSSFVFTPPCSQVSMYTTLSDSTLSSESNNSTYVTAKSLTRPSIYSRGSAVSNITSASSRKSSPSLSHKFKVSAKNTSPKNQLTKSTKSPEESMEDQDDEAEATPRVCRWVDCNAVFTDRPSLSRHIERAHVDQRKGEDFTCFWAACQRKYRAFNARYKLLIHMRVHSGEKPNKCNFPGCDKAFSRLENLKIHQRSHTGERPYICVHALCSKAFSNSSDRAKHQRTHLDAKPYVCSVPFCQKRYTDPSSLRKHVKNHSPRDQLLAKRKAETKDSLGPFKGPLMAPLPNPLGQEEIDSLDQKNLVGGGSGDELSPNGDIGGDVVKFSLRCHVLSRRPREVDHNLSLPELTLASQDDLDLWIS